jgi:hypothetical protein
MQDFIRDENIKLYRTALSGCTDEEQRRVLLVLLRLLIIEQAESTKFSKPFGPKNSLSLLPVSPETPPQVR